MTRAAIDICDKLALGFTDSKSHRRTYPLRDTDGETCCNARHRPRAPPCRAGIPRSYGAIAGLRGAPIADGYVMRRSWAAVLLPGTDAGVLYWRETSTTRRQYGSHRTSNRAGALCATSPGARHLSVRRGTHGGGGPSAQGGRVTSGGSAAAQWEHHGHAPADPR